MGALDVVLLFTDAFWLKAEHIVTVVFPPSM